MKINDATSKECYQDGFNAAREKARGIVTEVKTIGLMSVDLSGIAQRIEEIDP